MKSLLIDLLILATLIIGMPFAAHLKQQNIAPQTPLNLQNQ